MDERRTPRRLGAVVRARPRHRDRVLPRGPPLLRARSPHGHRPVCLRGPFPAGRLEVGAALGAGAWRLRVGPGNRPVGLLVATPPRRRPRGEGGGGHADRALPVAPAHAPPAAARSRASPRRRCDPLAPSPSPGPSGCWPPDLPGRIPPSGPWSNRIDKRSRRPIFSLTLSELRKGMGCGTVAPEVSGQREGPFWGGCK
jgi:hypothetical protein